MDSTPMMHVHSFSNKQEGAPVRLAAARCSSSASRPLPSPPEMAAITAPCRVRSSSCNGWDDMLGCSCQGMNGCNCSAGQ